MGKETKSGMIDHGLVDRSEVVVIDESPFHVEEGTRTLLTVWISPDRNWA